MNYLKSVYNARQKIMFLAYENIKKQYLETVFGIAWAVVQPAVYMITFFFLYKYGIKGNSTIYGAPFLLYIFAANMPWLVMSQTLTQGSKVFLKNSVLITTIKFPVMVLPFAEVLAKIYVHIFVMLMVFVVFMGYGYYPDLYYLNFLFYWPMLVVFLVGITFLLGTLSVLFRDIPPLIASILMPLFWYTPIVWYPQGPQMELFEKIFNPFYFFVYGYRNTMLLDKNFWESPQYMIYFIVLNIIIYIIALRVYKNTKSIMADII